MLTPTLLETGDQASLAALVARLERLATHGVRLAGILPCRHDRRRTAPGAMLAALRDAYGELVLDPVPDRAELGELALYGHGQSLSTYHPTSDALPAYHTALTRLFDLETR